MWMSCVSLYTWTSRHLIGGAITLHINCKAKVRNKSATLAVSLPCHVLVGEDYKTQPPWGRATSVTIKYTFKSR